VTTAITPVPYSSQNPATTYASWLYQQANGAPLAGIRGSNLDSSVLQTATFILTSADIIAMGTGNGVSLLGTPPVVYSEKVSPVLGTSGFSATTGLSNSLVPSLIVIHKAVFELLWLAGNVAYTGGGVLSLVYTGGAVTEFSTVPAAGVTNTALTTYTFNPLATSTGTLMTASRGVGISIVNTGGAFAAGNSQAYVKIQYSLSS